MQWQLHPVAGKAADVVQTCRTNNMSHTASFYNLKEKVANLANKLTQMNLVQQERKQLRHLSAKELKDMGVTPDDARVEARRSYFDIPEDRQNKS